MKWQTHHLIIAVIICSFVMLFVGMLFGYEEGRKETVKDFLNFLDESDIQININFNETRMVDYMMDKVNRTNKRYDKPFVMIDDDGKPSELR